LTRIISVDDLAGVVREVGLDALLDQLIAALGRALATHDPSRLETRDRTGFHYREPVTGLLEWMPAMELGRRVSIKTVGYHPANPTERGTPSVLATTSLYDTSDGRLVTICEATILTALRTGAASAVATNVLAVPDASVLGVVGCGAQAVSQIHALSRVRPLARVLAYDVDGAVARSLPSRLAGIVEIPIEILDEPDLGRLMAEVDVLCTCTTVEPGAGPVIPMAEHRPWLHINAVGADFAGKSEIPAPLLRDALVCPDVPGQCLVEGEAQQLSMADLGPDLAQLARNAGEYRAYRRRLTVFDSTGWALEDLVAAELVAGHCEALGLGTTVELQPATADPYNPYERLRAAATIPGPLTSPDSHTSGVLL
jgi:ornithine cyclodeaminase/alanine dehydrogenase-like protein (mu-crystallin family)